MIHYTPLSLLKSSQQHFSFCKSLISFSNFSKYLFFWALFPKQTEHMNLHCISVIYLSESGSQIRGSHRNFKSQTLELVAGQRYNQRNARRLQSSYILSLCLFVCFCVIFIPLLKLSVNCSNSFGHDDILMKKGKINN